MAKKIKNLVDCCHYDPSVSVHNWADTDVEKWKINLSLLWEYCVLQQSQDVRGERYQTECKETEELAGEMCNQDLMC